MKQSTRKLLDVLDDIQSKAFSKTTITRSNTVSENKEEFVALDDLDDVSNYCFSRAIT